MRRDRNPGSHAARGGGGHVRGTPPSETRSRRRPEARGRGEARSSPRALEAAAAPTDARRNARATRERERAPESLNGANRVDEIVPKRESRADETETRIKAARRAPRRRKSDKTQESRRDERPVTHSTL